MREKEIREKINQSLNKTDTFVLDKISIEDYRPMKNHDWITQQHTPTTKERNWFRPLLSLGLSFVVAFFIFIGFNHFKNPLSPKVDSLIYVDVNPTIQFEVDQNDKVISLKSRDSQGQKIIDNMDDYKSKQLKDVVIKMLDEMIEQDYLIEKMPTVLVSVINEDQDVANKQMKLVDRLVEGYFDDTEIMPLVINQKSKQVEKEIESLAKVNNISVSKMIFVSHVYSIHNEKDINELSQMSLDELIDYLLKSGKDLDSIDSRLNGFVIDIDQGKDLQVKPVDVIELPEPIEPPVESETEKPKENIEHKKPEPVVTSKQETKSVPIPFETEIKMDETLNQGVSKVTQEGVNGERHIIYQVNYSDGKETDRKEISNKIVKAPVNKIVSKGTKEVVTTTNKMSLIEAINSVLNRFNGGSVIQKIEYNYDSNNPLYKGEAVKAGYKVVFEINARTKTFIKWDVSSDSEFENYTSLYRSSTLMISAIDKVVLKSGNKNTFVQKIEFDWDQSSPMFKGEAFSLNKKYQFELDASNLNFYKFDVSSGDDTYQTQYFNVKTR